MFDSVPNRDATPTTAPASATGVRLVLHDRDNTLVTENVSFYAYHALLNEALRKDGKPEIGIQAIEALGVGGRYEEVLRTLEAKYHVTIGDPAITDLHARYAPEMLKATEIMQRQHQKILPDVLGVTHILAAAGVAQAVCTNNDLAISHNGLALAGLTDIFPKARTYSADDVFKLHPGKTAAELINQNIGFKPAGDLYQHALEKEGCDGANAIAIEDSVTGITAAKHAGIGIRIGTLSIHKQAGESAEQLAARAAVLRKAGATHIIESYHELLPILIEHGTPKMAVSIKRQIDKINAAGEHLHDDPVKNAVANIERTITHQKGGTKTMAPTSSAIHGFFKPDDCAFLEGIFARFPEIGVTFNEYLAMPAAKRPEAAMEDLDNEQRTGWVLRRIPNPETVFDHSKRLGAKARALAEEARENPDILKLTDEEKTRYKNELPLNPEHLEALADAHDLPEALVTDFPPNIAQNDPSKHVAKDEKKRLEKLAARVIYEADPAGMACYEEYEAKQTLSARLLSDLDKIDPCHLALIYETHCRQDGKNFDSHLVTAREKLLTAYGKRRSMPSNKTRIRFAKKREES